MARKTPSEKSRRKVWGGMVPGLILIAMGGIFLLDNYGFTSLNIGKLWPVFMIIPGVFMVMGLHQRD